MVVDENMGSTKNVTMVREEIGGFEACDSHTAYHGQRCVCNFEFCLTLVLIVILDSSICEVKPCFFDGVYQPSLIDTFSQGKVLLLSYFYDRIQPLLPKLNPLSITVSTLSSLAMDVCLGKPAWLKKWGSDKDAMEELEDHLEYCLDLTFMHALLRLGYEFGDSREVTIGKKIIGTELGWCTGDETPYCLYA